MSGTAIVALYLVGVYPAYRVFLWLRSKESGGCTKGAHRNAVAMAICWPSFIPVLVIFAALFVILAPFAWAMDKWEQSEKLSRFSARWNAWWDDKTPCK